MKYILSHASRTLLQLGVLFFVCTMVGPGHAHASQVVWDGTFTDSPPGTKTLYPFPSWSFTSAYGFTTTHPGGFATGYVVSGHSYDSTVDISSLVDQDGVENHATNPDSLTFGIAQNNSNDQWLLHNDTLTANRACALMDPTATGTIGSTGSFNSPQDNQLVRFGQVPPYSVWQKGHADDIGNSYIRRLICATNALPANTISASPTSINAGESSTLTFDAGPNALAQSTSCTTTNFTIPTHQDYEFQVVTTSESQSRGVDGDKYTYAFMGVPLSTYSPDTTGSITVSPTVTTTYVYSCTNGNGTTVASATVTVNEAVPPAADVTLTAAPTTISSGGSATLNWSSTDATSCTSSNIATGGATSGSVSVSPTTSTTYSMSCAGPGGSSAVTYATVTVTGGVTSASFSASPTSIGVGQSSTLSWSTTNTYACTGTNFSTGGAISGTAVVSPLVTTAYTLSCSLLRADGTEDTTSMRLTRTASVTVAAPNLTAGTITPTAATVGTAVTLTSLISNTGSASTGSTFTDLFQTAADASGTGATAIGTYTNPIRAAGTSANATLSYTFPSAGTTYVRACADNNASFVGTIAESNESDNCSAWVAVTVSAPTSGPNLSAAGPTPTTATAGTAVTISSALTNLGNASTGAGFTNLFQFDNDTDHSAVTMIQTSSSTALGAGATRATSVTQTFPTGGAWYVRACADMNASFTGSIVEINESDNCSAWVSVNVAAATGANLVTGTVTPITATVGTSVAMSAPVTNAGTISTGTGFTNLFQFDADSDHRVVTSYQTDASSVLGSGLTDTSSVTQTFPSAGTWYVRVCADNNASFAGTVIESDETDNCGSWTAISVASVMATTNLTAGDPTPSTATAGSPVTMSSIITNAGAGSTAYGFTNLFQFDSDSNHTTITSTQTDASPVLAGGGLDTSTVSQTFSSTGTWYVRVCADNNASFAGSITESNEADNCSGWVPVTVGAATGINLSAGTVTPIVATAGTALTLSASISNTGSASTAKTFTDVFQIATDATGTGATAIGTYSNPVRAAGTSGVASLLYTFPSAGTTYVRACADNNASFVGTITETNEGDNCGPWTAITVANPSSGVNLVAGLVTPTTATAGTPISMNSTISNSGAVSTGSGFTNLFQFDNDSNHTTITSTQTDASPSLVAGGTDVSTVTQNFPTAGTWYVRACADNNVWFVGSVTESNEGDNCGSWRTITVSNPTGAGVTSCTVTPTSIASGDSATWTASPSGLGAYTWVPTEGGAPGGTGATLVRSYSGTNATFGMTVTAGGATVNCPNLTVGASPFGPAVPTISVSPARVVSGSTSVITVSATGVDTSCTVSGPGVSQTIAASGGTIPTTNITTPALTTQSTYSITCDGAEAVAKGIINVIPGVQEF